MTCWSFWSFLACLAFLELCKWPFYSFWLFGQPFWSFSSPWTAIFYDLPSQIWQSQISDHPLIHQIWHSHWGFGDLWFPISTGLRVFFHFWWQSYPRKPWKGVPQKRFWTFHGLQGLSNDQANKAADGWETHFGRKMLKLTQNTLQKEATYTGSPFWQNTQQLSI